VGPIAEFFLKHTKGELWEEGVKRRVMVYPVASARDVLGDRHLHERGFWVELEHSELNDVLRYPGAFVKTADGLCGPRRRSPLIGEHNAEILGGELGITRGEMEILKQNAII
jgi:crotonobetainyl-CoA:carnitine CoA-transferase CaiB-like acyl-CoA transferase